MTRLVLIRHGEAQAYLDQVIAGVKGDSGLSTLGRRQVEALRDRLARTGELADTTALYASILPRAIETASILTPALGDLATIQDCDLCELHPGEADGMAWEEWRQQFPVDDWDADTRMSPGGESWREFVARVEQRLRHLVVEHPEETVVVACHGGVIESSMIAGLDLPVPGPRHFAVTNTSLTEWQIQSGEPWQLVRYNDSAHLADRG